MIAVAIRYIVVTADITGVFISPKTRGRLILDVDNYEGFESDTIEITINYQLSLFSGIRVYTGTLREAFGARIRDSNYIVFGGVLVHYRCKSSTPASAGSQEFVIFRKGWFLIAREM